MSSNDIDWVKNQMAHTLNSKQNVVIDRPE